MTYTESYQLFWGGLLGVLAICWVLCRLWRKPWDEYTIMGTIAAVAFVALWWRTFGLP